MVRASLDQVCSLQLLDHVTKLYLLVYTGPYGLMCRSPSSVSLELDVDSAAQN